MHSALGPILTRNEAAAVSHRTRKDESEGLSVETVRKDQKTDVMPYTFTCVPVYSRVIGLFQQDPLSLVSSFLMLIIAPGTVITVERDAFMVTVTSSPQKSKRLPKWGPLCMGPRYYRP